MSRVSITDHMIHYVRNKSETVSLLRENNKLLSRAAQLSVLVVSAKLFSGNFSFAQFVTEFIACLLSLFIPLKWNKKLFELLWKMSEKQMWSSLNHQCSNTISPNKEYHWISSLVRRKMIQLLVTSLTTLASFDLYIRSD